MGIELIKEYAKEDHVIFDLKSIFVNHETDIRLLKIIERLVR